MGGGSICGNEAVVLMEKPREENRRSLLIKCKDEHKAPARTESDAKIDVKENLISDGYSFVY